MEERSECMNAKSSFMTSMYVSYECLVPSRIIKACIKLHNVFVNNLADFPSVFYQKIYSVVSLPGPNSQFLPL